MAKKKAAKNTKVLKTLVGRLKMKRVARNDSANFPDNQDGYDLGRTNGQHLWNRLCEVAVHSILGKTICRVGETATVKITIEVEKVE